MYEYSHEEEYTNTERSEILENPYFCTYISFMTGVLIEMLATDSNLL